MNPHSASHNSIAMSEASAAAAAASTSEEATTSTGKRRVHDDDDEEEDEVRGTPKRGGVRRTVPGGKADCDGRRVPDGFLYHVVGAEEQAGPGAPIRLLVRPGVPACWTHTNAGFFVGRHIAKFLPDVPQYACAPASTAKAAAKATRRRTIPAKSPLASSYAWPAYEVDFDSSAIQAAAAGVMGDTPTLSQLYTNLVLLAVSHMPDIAVFLKSDSADFKARAEVDGASEFLLAPFFGKANYSDGTEFAVHSLELVGVASPLLLATHCLILDRDIECNPGPAHLVDSIPPIMRHDGMPDIATLERWADIMRRRCRVASEPLLAWGAASIQFGEGAYEKRKSLWDVVHQQVAAATAVNKSRGCSHHDAWIESVFRVASVPFVAFLLKRRGVTLPETQLPLADMPVWSRAADRPLVALHPLAPKRIFNIAAVLASVMLHTEMSTNERPQVQSPPSPLPLCAGPCNLREVGAGLLRSDVGRVQQHAAAEQGVCVGGGTRTLKVLIAGPSLSATHPARHCGSDTAHDTGICVRGQVVCAGRAVGPRRAKLLRVVWNVGRRAGCETHQDAERTGGHAARHTVRHRSEQPASSRHTLRCTIPPGRNCEAGVARRRCSIGAATPRLCSAWCGVAPALLRVQHGAAAGASDAHAATRRRPPVADVDAVFRPTSPLPTPVGARRTAPTRRIGRSRAPAPAGAVRTRSRRRRPGATRGADTG